MFGKTVLISGICDRKEVYALNSGRGYNSRFSMAKKIGWVEHTPSEYLNIAKI